MAKRESYKSANAANRARIREERARRAQLDARIENGEAGDKRAEKRCDVVVPGVSSAAAYDAIAERAIADAKARGVLPVTADTITDEQIRELLSSVPPHDQVTRDTCNVALGVLFLPYLYRPAARARCAEIINARMGKG